MTIADLLNKLLCSKNFQIICIEGGTFFEFVAWLLIAALAIYLFWLWREGPQYKKKNRIDGKIVIITGCNTGIGKEIALELAKRGGHIYMACRNYDKCENARKEIIQKTGNRNIFNRTLNLSSLKSVREFAEKFLAEQQRLDILVNNAGMMSTPRVLTEDGFEQQFGVNHLGHFLLTNLLLERLKSSAPSRIVVLSSLAYIFGKIKKDDLNNEKSYTRFVAYGQSKLANILFTRKLARILKGTKVTVNCMHPGSVQSELTRYDPVLGCLYAVFAKLVLRTTRSGAQTALYLALDPDLKDASGDYYDRMRKPLILLSRAKDDKMADWLWQESERLVGLNTV